MPPPHAGPGREAGLSHQPPDGPPRPGGAEAARRHLAAQAESYSTSETDGGCSPGGRGGRRGPQEWKMTPFRTGDLGPGDQGRANPPPPQGLAELSTHLPPPPAPCEGPCNAGRGTPSGRHETASCKTHGPGLSASPNPVTWVTQKGAEEQPRRRLLTARSLPHPCPIPSPSLPPTPPGPRGQPLPGPTHT